MSQDAFKSGFITLLGRPNAGKSTLLNAVMGRKLAITTPVAQTTRHRFRAIKTTDDYQLVIVDTPGIHKPHDALGEELNTTALKSLDGIDVVAFLLDASAPLGTGDAFVIESLKDVKAPKILVITKIDLVDPPTVQKQLDAALALGKFDAHIVTSSTEGFNVDQFCKLASSYLPEGPMWFPADLETDQPIEVIIAEFIREKILQTAYDEVPHAVGVVVEEMEYNRRKNLQKIYATVYVEHESQKGIVIGKGGKALKEVGTRARADLERFLDCKVFLDLHVKVRKNWRRDLNQIRRFGYGEGT